MDKSSNIVVLSLFNGLGGVWIALDRLGVEVGKRYSSEIDKYANIVNDANYPDTIQLGDITKIDVSKLDKINLVVGGSPCQGFSFAGKQLNFDDPRSALFFKYVRVLNDVKKINPDVKFLLENVKMKKEYLRVISEYLGVFPVNINSNLVSAQNRNRWYWTNIRTRKEGFFNEVWSDIPQPKDKGILLKDILQPEDEVDKKYYIKNPKVGFEGMDINGKNNSLRTGGKNSQSKKHNYDIIPVVNNKGNLREVKLSSCLDANYFKGIDNHAARTAICVAMRGREDGQELEPQKDGKTNCITSVSKDNLIMQINPSKESGGVQPYQQNRVYDTEGQMPALNAELGGRNNIIIQESDKRLINNIRGEDEKAQCLLSTSYKGSRANGMTNITDGYKLRRLTPIECERLQTVPDNYTNHVSDTQRYKMLGNGFTSKVIEHILSYLTK